MRLEKFSYNGKDRCVLVTEESSTHLKGIDMGNCPTPEEREKIIKLTESIDHSKWSGMDQDEVKGQVAQLKPYMKWFRNFKKSEIKKVDE